MTQAIVVDLRKTDEMCGDPGVDRVTAALESAQSGAVIEVITASRDIEFTASAWAKKHGHTVVEIRRVERESYLTIKKRG